MDDKVGGGAAGNLGGVDGLAGGREIAGGRLKVCKGNGAGGFDERNGQEETLGHCQRGG